MHDVLGIVSTYSWSIAREECILTFCSFLLVRHPQALERLRSEINSVVSDGEDLSRSHIQRMPYLKCVLNESKTPYLTFTCYI
jgi:hypothetical protein